MNTKALDIVNLEQVLERAFTALQNPQLNAGASKAAPYFWPKGYRPVITLKHGDGRKIRSNAAASNFSPSADQIVIKFERVLEKYEQESIASPSRPMMEPIFSLSEIPNPIAGRSVSTEGEVTDTDIRQCCDALAKVEKTGKPFIALKWFRDLVLPGYGYAWTKSSVLRQRVLAKSIDIGEIEVKKIPNPNAPDRPTAAINLRGFGAPAAALSRISSHASKGIA
jgi:hypothetical protein